MFVPKGYRAREAAAKLRNSRKLVTEDVRAARAAVLFDADAAAVEAEVPVTDETTNSTPPAQTEPEKVEADEPETAKVEGEPAAAPKVDEPKAAAPKADAKAKGKAKHKAAASAK